MLATTSTSLVIPSEGGEGNAATVADEVEESHPSSKIFHVRERFLDSVLLTSFISNGGSRSRSTSLGMTT
jgi:hypothetical protein